MGKLIFLALSCFSFFLSVDAQQHKTKVLLLGTFHFDNPGLDVAKFDNANILSEKRQAEVKVVMQKLLEFRPDKIFVEAPPSAQGRLDSNFRKYKTGEIMLNAGELHQLGFRLAKELNLPGLQAVDYTEAEFPFDSLVKSASEAKQFYLLGYIKNSIDSIQRIFNESLKVKTVRELLLDQNTREVIAFQVGMYYEFLVTGKEGNHVGSYLTAEWWRRNMIIYENILKRLNGREERILVIFGSGHTALLNEMMKYNKNIEIVPVDKVL
jgi:Family of unknown function (DUF5694)